MSSPWRRTSALANFYGYWAETQEEGDRWNWVVTMDGKRLARGSASREASARVAARRWILAQPDAKAAHDVATRVHWNGRPFDGSQHISWSGNPKGDSAVCAIAGGSATNKNRDKINCERCLERLAESEAAKAVAP